MEEGGKVNGRLIGEEHRPFVRQTASIIEPAMRVKRDFCPVQIPPVLSRRSHCSSKPGHIYFKRIWPASYEVAMGVEQSSIFSPIVHANLTASRNAITSSICGHYQLTWIEITKNRLEKSTRVLGNIENIEKGKYISEGAVSKRSPTRARSTESTDGKQTYNQRTSDRPLTLSHQEQRGLGEKKREKIKYPLRQIDRYTRQTVSHRHGFKYKLGTSASFR